MKTPTEIATAIELVKLGLYDETKFKLELVEACVMTQAFNDILIYLGIQEVLFEHDAGTQRWMDLSQKALNASRFVTVMKTAHFHPIEDSQVYQTELQPQPHKFCVKVKLIDYNTFDGITRSLLIPIEPDFTITQANLAGAQNAILGAP